MTPETDILELSTVIPEDYSEILQKFGLRYKRNDLYFQIGEIDWEHGWILDLSTISTQIAKMLDVIIPSLVDEAVPFKIVINREIAKAILDGLLGYIHLAKIASIYPCNGIQAKRIAETIIALTASFRGPRILTDRHLGSIVYTRYGACKPITIINKNGAREKYVHNSEGVLIKEQYSIPFMPPLHIPWPFEGIASPMEETKDSVFQEKYKPISIIKADARGTVQKALWLRHIFQISWCLIKEGRHNMNADSYGRDVGDRLIWQYQLQTDLHGVIPVPKVYDLFQQDGDTYLVMHYIKGKTLEYKVDRHFKGRILRHLPLKDRLNLLDYSIQLLEIIGQMHTKGYVHRDITPLNFLVTKSNRLILIDLELSYSYTQNNPYPPFRFGTEGFMSPEQQKNEVPTIKEDIYSLGAIMIFIFTNLLPRKFSIEHPDIIFDQLHFFIQDAAFSNIIALCLNECPDSRPSLNVLRTHVQNFRESQLRTNHDSAIVTYGPSPTSLDRTIYANLAAMATPKLITNDSLWFSRTIQDESFSYSYLESFSIYCGYQNGLSGVLYMLARAHKLGIPIAPCIKGYSTSWEYIRKEYLGKSQKVPAGFFSGTAGIVLALVEGLESGLLSREEQITSDLKCCLLNTQLDGQGVARGIAGLGIVSLRCLSHIEEDFILPIIHNQVDSLLRDQQKDGSWMTGTNDSAHLLKVTGISNGVAGIASFLLSYSSQFKDSTIQTLVLRAFHWLKNKSRTNKGQLIWYLHNKTNRIERGVANGIAGIALSFIKAYEVIGDPAYKTIAENALRTFPTYLVERDLTQANGLAGIGEVYLEAERVFATEEWKTRSSWIADVLIHQLIWQTDGSSFWQTDNSPHPTADFLTGNSGVLHFLIRYHFRGKLSHPLFPA